MGLLKGTSESKWINSCPVCKRFHPLDMKNVVPYTRSCSLICCPDTRVVYMRVSNPIKCLGCNDTVGCNGKKKTLI